MIDVSKFSKKKKMSVFLLQPEKAIIIWLHRNKFSGKLITANSNKMVIEVERDGIKDTFEITSTRKQDVFDAIEYCEQFEKSFNLKVENNRLRELLKRNKEE